MLQDAATAHAEVHAAWLDALGRGFEHRDEFGFIVIAFALAHLVLDQLAWQRAGDEHGLATAGAGSHDAPAVAVQCIDAALRRLDHCGAVAGHCCRNSR